MSGLRQGHPVSVLSWTTILARVPALACVSALACLSAIGIAEETPPVRRLGETHAVTVFRPDLSDAAVLGLRRNHPLAPALKLALSNYGHIEANIRDYSCLLIRRERVNGRLGPHEYIQAKIRHERRQDNRIVVPFSVYLKFLGPASVKDREVLYVAGRNEGRMRARRGGPRFGYITAWLSPDSDVAMKNNRYPLTDIGVKHLVRRLIVLARQELGRNVCQVTFAKDARIDGRDCMCIDVVRPMPGDSTCTQHVRIFVDDKLGIPIHYESHRSRSGDEGPFELVEQYTFRELRLNVGLTDRDFDVDNPQYRLK